MTLIQLLICHVIILAFASLTRGLQSLFQAVGLGAVVAPPHAYTRGGRATRYRGGQKYKPIWQNVMNWLTHGSGGIAGGGLFEWQWKTAKHVLPVAVVFMAKVVLSNLSYAYDPTQRGRFSLVTHVDQISGMLCCQCTCLQG